MYKVDTVKKWYENIAKSAEGKSLTFFNSEFKTKFEEKLKALNIPIPAPAAPVAPKAIAPAKKVEEPDRNNADFLAKLNNLRGAGPPGPGMKY